MNESNSNVVTPQAASLAGRVGPIGGGVVGGSLAGIGIGFAGFFLLVLIPVVAMSGITAALAIDAKKRGNAAAEDQLSVGAAAMLVKNVDSGQ